MGGRGAAAEKKRQIFTGARCCPALLRNMIFNCTRPSRITPPFYSYNLGREERVHERGKARSIIEAAAREEARGYERSRGHNTNIDRLLSRYAL